MLFSVFLTGSVESFDVNTKQPVPIIEVEIIGQPNTCTPYPECKIK